ncbi:hypothetical protein [Thaumasiovibrio subtropicus]|uniref:hypothetical protein n=1 Tax=Thaumasiovibrio subtropicus TaxID=1891207 RepID=UPI000B35212E|nr:hypothetical protein [Thaumasiovibrio subtropicus]
MYYLKFIKALPLVISSLSAWGSTLPEWLSVSGFASTAAAKSDNTAPYYYSRNISDEWCFDCDTIVGLQLDAHPNDWLHLSVQGVKRPVDNFSEPALEWAYVAFSPTESFSLRTGRLRSPTFMYSQVVFVNQAYPWLRLPAEVYDTTKGFTRYDGLDARYQIETDNDLIITFHPYMAYKSTIRDNEINNYSWDVYIHEHYGLKLDIEGINWSAYLNHYRADITVTSDELLVPSGFPVLPTTPFVPFKQDVQTKSWTYGIKYDWQDWTFVFEGAGSDSTSWGGYLSAIYTWDKFTPYIVYGKRSPTSDDNPEKSDSFSLGLRYDIKPNLSIVGEWHHTKTGDGNYRGSFTPPTIQEIEDRSANIISIGINYSFAF